MQVQVFGYQLNNGIPIASWYEDTNDCELLHLLPFLAELAVAEDVRPLVANRFPLHRHVPAAQHSSDITTAEPHVCNNAEPCDPHDGAYVRWM